MNTGQPDHSTPPRLHLGDAIGISIFTINLLVCSYLRSRHMMFWSDEMMGWFVLRQPTWHALLHLWNDGIDSSGIFFYVLGRPWLAAFGASEVTLRMFSAAGVAAAAAVLWITARRFYSFLPVAASLSFVYAFLATLRWQLANGRTYGVFLLAISLVVYVLLRGEDEDQSRPGPGFLLATFAAYSLLNGSHILGVLYAGAFFALQLGMDLRSRRFRPWLYLSVACSAWVTVFSRANLRATMALGKPSFWTPHPTLQDLIKSRIMLGNRVVAVIALLLLLIGLSHFKIKPRRLPVYELLLGFAVLDLVIFAYSLFRTSIYVDRYLLPFHVGAVLLLCELFTQLRETHAPWPRLGTLLAGFFLLLAVAGFYLHSLQVPFYPLPDYTAGLVKTLPPGLPIIDTDPGSFVEIQFYQRGKMDHSILFPTDWSVALDPHTKGGVSGYHEIDNFKADGLYAEDIQPTADLLARYRDFIVITNHDPADDAPGVWLDRYVMNNPVYTAKKIGNYPGGILQFTIWEVHAR